MTQQEDIAHLRGQPVPEADDFVFGDEARRDGDVFDIDVVSASDGASIGTARGKTADEIVRHAQEIA